MHSQGGHPVLFLLHHGLHADHGGGVQRELQQALLHRAQQEERPGNLGEVLLSHWEGLQPSKWGRGSS